MTLYPPQFANGKSAGDARYVKGDMNKKKRKKKISLYLYLHLKYENNITSC
jgi:hypothetical protein